MAGNGPSKFGKNAGNSGRHFLKFGGPIFRHLRGPFRDFLGSMGVYLNGQKSSLVDPFGTFNGY